LQLIATYGISTISFVAIHHCKIAKERMKIHINFREGVDTIDIYRVYLVVLALETAMDESAPLSASDTESSEGDQNNGLVRHSRSVVGSEFDRRSLLLAVIGLLLVLIVSSLSTVFYYWDGLLTDDPEPTHHKASCRSNNVQSVEMSELLRSPCADSFYWTADSPDTVRNISVLNCNFQSVSSQLGFLLAMVKRSKEIVKCLDYAVPLICHAMFRDCESNSGRPSLRQCVEVRDQDCRQWWTMTRSFFRTFEPTKRANCLVFPDCEEYFGKSDNYTFPRSNSYNHSVVPCRAPLVNTDIYYERFPFKCSPKCLEKDWPAPAERVTFNIMLHVTIAFCWICCIIVLITWARSPDLRSFPQNTLFFLTISYTISVFAISLPVFIGRHRAYCSHDDMISSWADPSTICNVQGKLLHATE
jgi:hypothetical protein